MGARTRKKDSAPKAALSFLTLLDPEAPGFSFQTFDDKGENSGLSGILHGTLAQHAAELGRRNRQGAGVFVTVNETNLKGRSKKHVKRVRAVFADLDGAPLDPVLAYKLKPHIIVETSPDKYHAYWLLDGLALGEFKRTQQNIAALFKSDPQVCDLPRVMRLPGYNHLKGDPFLTRLVGEISDAPRYTARQIMGEFYTVDGNKPKPKPKPKDQGEDAGAEDGANIIPITEDLDGPLIGRMRNNTLTSIAGQMKRAGVEEQEIKEHLRGVNERRCKSPLPVEEVDGIARSSENMEGGPDLSEAGAARRFHKMFGSVYAYVVPSNRPMIFRDGWWRWDDELARDAMALKVAASYHRGLTGDKKKDKKILRRIEALKTNYGVNAVLRLAQHLHARDEGAHDRRPMLLNFKNCTLDLKTGKARAHDHKDLLTMGLDYDYDPEARCPEFDKFLDQAQGGDKKQIAAIWRAAGYTLTGFTVEQIIFLLQGPSESGKSTFLEMFEKVLGPYVGLVEARTLEAGSDGRSTGVGDDLVLFKGKRLLIADEIPRRRLNETRLRKIATGGMDVGRALFGKAAPFEQTAKLWMGTNFLKIYDLDESMFRRLIPLPFPNSISNEKRNVKLWPILWAEKAGFMNRALAGLRDYRGQGLAPTAKSIEALAKHRRELNPLNRFLDTYTEDTKATDPEAFVPFDTLYDLYQKYMSGAPDFIVLSANGFAAALDQAGYVKARKRFLIRGKSKQGTARLGLRLLTERERGEEAEY